MGWTIVRGVPRQNVGWQDRQPVYRDVPLCGKTCRLSLVFSLPVGLRKTSDGTSERQFINVAKGINFIVVVDLSPEADVSPAVDGHRNRGGPTGFARSRSDVIGTGET